MKRKGFKKGRGIGRLQAGAAVLVLGLLSGSLLLSILVNEGRLPPDRLSGFGLGVFGLSVLGASLTAVLRAGGQKLLCALTMGGLGLLLAALLALVLGRGEDFAILPLGLAALGAVLPALLLAGRGRRSSYM